MSASLALAARPRRILVVLGMLMLLVLAPGRAAADSEVIVSLFEYGVAADPATVQEGTVTFQVTNNGAIPHNFVVIKTDLAPTALPVNQEAPNERLVDESQLNVVARTPELWVGETGSTTVGLVPGSYVLICNNARNHYQAGMYVGFQVTALATPIGGVGFFPDVPDSSGGNAGVVTALIAAATAGALALGGAAWWARRRWLSR